MFSHKFGTDAHLKSTTVAMNNNSQIFSNSKSKYTDIVKNYGKTTTASPNPGPSLSHYGYNKSQQVPDNSSKSRSKDPHSKSIHNHNTSREYFANAEIRQLKEELEDLKKFKFTTFGQQAGNSQFSLRKSTHSFLNVANQKSREQNRSRSKSRPEVSQQTQNNSAYYVKVLPSASSSHSIRNSKKQSKPTPKTQAATLSPIYARKNPSSISKYPHAVLSQDVTKSNPKKPNEDHRPTFIKPLHQSHNISCSQHSHIGNNHNVSTANHFIAQNLDDKLHILTMRLKEIAKNNRNKSPDKSTIASRSRGNSKVSRDNSYSNNTHPHNTSRNGGFTIPLKGSSSGFYQKSRPPTNRNTDRSTNDKKCKKLYPNSSRCNQIEQQALLNPKTVAPKSNNDFSKSVFLISDLAPPRLRNSTTNSDRNSTLKEYIDNSKQQKLLLFSQNKTGLPSGAKSKFQKSYEALDQMNKIMSPQTPNYQSLYNSLNSNRRIISAVRWEGQPHRAKITEVAINTQIDEVVYSCSDDYRVFMTKMARDSIVSKQLYQHRGTVKCMHFQQHSQTLITAGSDCFIRSNKDWSRKTPSVVTQMKLHSRNPDTLMLKSRKLIQFDLQKLSLSQKCVLDSSSQLLSRNLIGTKNALSQYDQRTRKCLQLLNMTSPVAVWTDNPLSNSQIVAIGQDRSIWCGTSKYMECKSQLPFTQQDLQPLAEQRLCVNPYYDGGYMISCHSKYTDSLYLYDASINKVSQIDISCLPCPGYLVKTNYSTQGFFWADHEGGLLYCNLN